jgi:CubicO group peptidase (beta-lactamase class C family)
VVALLPLLVATSPLLAGLQEGAELPPQRCTQLQQALEALAERYHLPGMSAAIVHRRALAWRHGFGLADLDHDVWAEPDTRYRIASVSKPFAAVLVLQLVEEGKLSLDAPMKDFHVPRWFAPDPARYREQPVLLRHVLTHTSEGERPGDTYAYNGNAFADLTWVIEEVAHTSYAELLQRRIFDPLEMKDSVPGHVRLGEKVPVEMARPYRWRGPEFEPVGYQILDPDPALDLAGFDPVLRMPEEALALRRELLGERLLHWNGVSSSDGIVTTVLDLAKFDVALDEDRLISRASRERMFTAAVASDGRVLPYGLGWFVEEIAGRKVLWHYGWLPPGVSALYVKVPEAELSFFLLANTDALSASFAWTREGVRASPFARAFLDAFGLDAE